MANFVKTSMLLALMTALFMGVGYLLGGSTGMLIALVVAAGMNLFSWWNSGNMVLRMHGARRVDRDHAPAIFEMVEALTKNAGLPMPKIYVLETAQPNAFATGRSPAHGAVAVSAGLLDALNEEEVAAVIAHELAHIRSRDTLVMTVTATLAGAVSMLANFAFFFRGNNNGGLGLIGTLIAMFVAPLAAGMVQMAISRTREYEADRDGAEICGQPLALASALRKIASHSGRNVNHAAEAAPATAHMFISNPLNGRGMDGLFSTHPATENRIAALEALHQQWQQAADHHETVVPQTKRHQEQWGRDAGTWRDVAIEPAADAEPDNLGPWGRSNPKRGPWG